MRSGRPYVVSREELKRAYTVLDQTVGVTGSQRVGCHLTVNAFDDKLGKGLEALLRAVGILTDGWCGTKPPSGTELGRVWIFAKNGGTPEYVRGVLARHGLTLGPLTSVIRPAVVVPDEVLARSLAHHFPYWGVVTVASLAVFVGWSLKDLIMDRVTASESKVA